jgi:serine/threonine protein kinase/Tol biopolymer transport system component
VSSHPPPTPDDWRRLEPLIDAVLDAPPSERPGLIDQLVGGDAERRAELERLVAECERAYPLIDDSALDRFAGILAAETPPLPELIAARYQVVREAGRGGMAIVYLARDLRHGRDVAIKVVRPELAAAIGRERFLREIEIAARLRHPHIVPLYDSGEVSAEDGGVALLYYVMPYEVGHSLRERLERDGPLPVADTVAVLRDLCEALAHAHKQDIVHRDIKPDNVLLSGGHALIADFGVARAVTEATTVVAGATVSNAVGTPTYMAPEQAAGGLVDHRADIYAIGVLAYELLSGRPPFMDDSKARHDERVTDAIRRLPRARADVTSLLSGVIARCLAELPQDRWQSADQLLAALDASVSDGVLATYRRHSVRPTALAVALVGAVSAVALVVAWRRERTAIVPLSVGRATQLTSERGLEVQPSVSPDGKYVAYAVGHSLRMRIAVKPLAGGRARWLTPDSTENQWLPRWSRDGTRLLFLSGGGAFSAPALTGGAIRQEVAPRAGAIVRSAAWSADGRTIAYVRGDSLLIRAVGANDARLVTTGPDLHSCRWSPDDAWLACVSGNSFYVTVGAAAGVGPMFGNLAPSRIVLVPAAGGARVAVTDSVSLNQSPAWSRDGRTLYYVSNRQGPRDIYAIDLRDRGRTFPEPVRMTTGMGAQSIELSADGAHLVYAAYSSSANVWTLPIPTAAPTSASPASAMAVTSGNQTVEGVRVSPDRRWLVFDSDLSGNSDVYRVSVNGGETERLTRGPSDAFRGTLSPDGRELAYHSFQTGSRNLFLASLDGAPPRQLTHSSGQLAMANWSPDGNALALFDMVGTRVMVMRRDAMGRWSEPRFIGGRGWRAEWSPDGRRIAFVSPTDGRIGLVPADSGASRDVYVPAEGDPLAELAVFAENGRELYFKSHDSRGRASFWSIALAGGRPRLLVRFDDPLWSSNRFDFASDGRRFYFTVEDRQSDLWVAELTR